MGDASQEPGLVAGCLIWVIRVVALLISLAVWTVVGFLYWIPMLVFAIIRFSALVVYTTLAGLTLRRSVPSCAVPSDSTSKAFQTFSWR
jgi:membrane protein implicated in regulation of membrane protease activity